MARTPKLQPQSYTKEDTGLAYDPNKGYLYISDDSKAGVFWVIR